MVLHALRRGFHRHQIPVILSMNPMELMDPMMMTMMAVGGHDDNLMAPLKTARRLRKKLIESKASTALVGPVPVAHLATLRKTFTRTAVGTLAILNGAKGPWLTRQSVSFATLITLWTTTKNVPWKRNTTAAHAPPIVNV